MENGDYRFVRQVRDGLRSMRDGDFQEEDVWAVLDDRNGHHHHGHDDFNSAKPQMVKPSQLFQRHQLKSAPRIIPSSGGDFNQRQQSAPVNIPEWRPQKKTKACVGGDDDDGYDDDDDDDDDGDVGDDDVDIMSPHEYFARRQAMSEISSFSVFQGIGRKLRGRDLSQVRNAVLIKTGFLERQ